MTGKGLLSARLHRPSMRAGKLVWCELKRLGARPPSGRARLRQACHFTLEKYLAQTMRSIDWSQEWETLRYQRGKKPTQSRNVAT
jgi:hypothetical protein